MKKLNTGKNYKEYAFESLADFVEFCRETCGKKFTLFRGQSVDKTLLPKIARPDLNLRKNLLDAEREILEDFKREIVALIDRVPDSPWDLLSLAQHHGLPTRLLDWTKNPLAALWYAVSKPQETRETNKAYSVLWIFFPDKKYIVSDSSKGDPFEGAFTHVFIPRHVTPRIRAQAAVFTVHKYITKAKRFVPLELNIVQQKRLIKIRIPISYFADIRFELDRCGINATSLIPDIDGLAQYLTWRYSKLEDEV